ncbi:glycosyltransferase [Candidatus Woesearchaeota archaeon]|nr:glycosyltransferase [Candidatus Woesearchaeota archaeon]
MEQKQEYKDVTIVIPTLNEEKNIEKLITLLKKTYKGITIIVVDDGSKDNTQTVAKKAGAQLIDRSEKPIHGLCISVIEGIQAAKTQYAIIMDGDMQHPYEKIGEIAEKLQHCGLVVGTREQVLNDWPVHRRLMSKLAITLGHLRLMIRGVYCEDIVSGFFGVQTKIFKEVIAKNYDKYELAGYKVLFDTLKYLPKNTKVYQLKYDFGLREAGASKINYHHVLYYFRSLFK